MNCRKRIVGVGTGGGGHLGMSLGGDLETGLGGTRLEGGVTLDQALMRNVGTCRPDAKGDIQAGGPCEDQSTDAGHRGGATRSSDEGPVMGLERRGRVVLACLLVNRGDAGGAG